LWPQFGKSLLTISITHYTSGHSIAEGGFLTKTTVSEFLGSTVNNC